MINPDRLSKILEHGSSTVSDADLHELIQAYRLLLALRDRAKSANCNPWALMRALALLGAEAPEAWTLDGLFDT